MNKVFFIAVLFWCGTLFIAMHAAAQAYTPTDKGSEVGFRIVNHLVFKSTVTGTLGQLQGSIHFEPEHTEHASFKVSVAVSTISTGIGARDNHLKKEEYFNAQQFPTILLQSTKVEKVAQANTYQLTGTLTIKGVSKPVTFTFTATPQQDGYLFQGSFNIKRLDYQVGPDNSIDNELTVTLKVLALKA
ncbi:YceI family protein [Chitinophaga costaii]|nr:YceI family protein [Chitinophaga costaii]